ncbi:MAG TPA: hypothetical protein GXX18_02015 [Bacillales bacterium]|nr:hypothetical protein [Bacillales bacterium]
MNSEQMFEKLMNEIKLIQTQQKETNEIVQAIHDLQEETDAKLDALTIDVHKIHGIVTGHTEIIESMIKINCV